MTKKITKKTRLALYSFIVLIVGIITGATEKNHTSGLLVNVAHADYPAGSFGDPCPGPGGCCE